MPGSHGKSPARSSSGPSIDGSGLGEDEHVALVAGVSPPSTGRCAALCAWRHTTRGRMAEGVALIVGVAVIWVSASVLVQYIYESFEGPFFLTYVSNSLFMVFLPMLWLTRSAKERGCCPGVFETLRAKPSSSSTPFTSKQTAKVAAIICPVWFAAQGTYNASLGQTSVSSSTILSTTSSLFTFALSVAFLKEPFRWAKLAGVVVCLGGAALVSISDDQDGGKDTLWGDMVCLLSALFYGMYTTMIRKLMPDEDAVSMPRFFGYLGLFNSILLLPLVLVLNATGSEDLSQLTLALLGLIVVKGLFDNVLSDLMWARSILLTTPTIATVGLSLTIPLAMLSDWIFKGLVPSWQLVVGSLAVTAGFVAVNVGTGADDGRGDTQRSASGGDGRQGSAGDVADGLSLPGQRAVSERL